MATAAEIERLSALRAALEAFLAQPPGVGGVGAAPVAAGEAVELGLPPPPIDSAPARAETEAAASPLGGEPPPTTASGQCPECGAQVKPQGLGTHRRVRHGVTGRNGHAPAPATTRCPECQKEVKTGGLGTHRRQAHGRGRRTTLVHPSTLPTAAADPRQIDELCPRGCGRRFRWEPSLHNHLASCDGVAA